jgi:hypothetical protein
MSYPELERTDRSGVRLDCMVIWWHAGRPWSALPA